MYKTFLFAMLYTNKKREEVKMTQTAERTFLKSLYLNLPKVYFILQILVGIWVSFWLLYNHQPKTGDDVEHIHSAWLVFQGYVPYQDFFSIITRCCGICLHLL